MLVYFYMTERMPTPTAVRTFARPAEILREAGIRAGWRVVDFGCGQGHYLVPAARFVGSTGRVVGIDILTSAVDTTKKRVEEAGMSGYTDVLRADLARPLASGLPDDWADLVLLSGILGQSDPVAVLKEAARVVKPSGGVVLVVEWDQIATPVGPLPDQRIERDAVLAAGKHAGLTLLTTFAPSPYQYGLRFVKAPA